MNQSNNRQLPTGKRAGKQGQWAPTRCAERTPERHGGHGSTRALLLISPPGTALSPPLWVTWKRSHPTEKSSSCDLQKWTLSAHKGNHFSYSTTLPHQHNGQWTTWGYKGSSLIHTFHKKRSSIYFHLWFWQQQPGLALLQLIWVCSSTSLLSYCFHPLIFFFISVPFSFVFLKHNIPFLCDLVPPLFGTASLPHCFKFHLAGG